MNKKDKELRREMRDKKESKTMTIMKFTFKETFFSRIFMLTNFLMILIVIFLSRTVLKLSTATENFVDNTITSKVETMYEEKGEVTSDEYEEIVSSANTVLTNTVTKTFNSGFVIAFILFFTIYFFGYMVSNAVSQEKTSRVIETLIMSAKPREIVFGKTIAMGIIGTMQMIELLIVFAISTLIGLDFKFNLNLFSLKNASAFFSSFGLALKNIFNLDNISFAFSFGNFKIWLSIVLVIIMLFGYFIFGYLFYAFICAIAGAGVDKAEDVQMVNGPISILAMIGFYLSVLTTSMPDSKWTVIAKYLPFSSAFAMPVNVISGTTTLSEMLITLGILMLSSMWLGAMAIKVYKHVIFNYGNKTSFKDVMKIIFLQK